MSCISVYFIRNRQTVFSKVVVAFYMGADSIGEVQLL